MGTTLRSRKSPKRWQSSPAWFANCCPGLPSAPPDKVVRYGRARPGSAPRPGSSRLRILLLADGGGAGAELAAGVPVGAAALGVAVDLAPAAALLAGVPRARELAGAVGADGA